MRILLWAMLLPLLIPDMQADSSIPVMQIFDKMTEVQDSIGVIVKCRVALDIITLLADMRRKSIADKEEEALMMIERIEDLAKRYWELESKTDRSVREIKIYGETIIEAGNDLLEDGIVKDFLGEVTDIEDVYKTLQVLNDQHGIIKGEVEWIGAEAKRNAKDFELKEQNTLNDQYDVICSIPAISGSYAGWYLTDRATQMVSSMPAKIVIGALTVPFVQPIGQVLSIGTAPYFWYKAIASHYDKEDYANLNEQFSYIAIQMQLIDVHMTKITGAVGEIETILNKTLRDQKKVKDEDGNISEKHVKKIMKRARTLIQACETYFELANMYKLSLN